MADSPTLNQTLGRRREERAAEQLMQTRSTACPTSPSTGWKSGGSICRSDPRSPTTGADALNAQGASIQQMISTVQNTRKAAMTLGDLNVAPPASAISHRQTSAPAVPCWGCSFYELRTAGRRGC